MAPTRTAIDILALTHTMMFDICAAQRSRLAGGVVGSRPGRSQCSLLAGGVVRAGWSVQGVGTHQVHLWNPTQEGGGLSRGESAEVPPLINDKMTGQVVIYMIRTRQNKYPASDSFVHFVYYFVKINNSK